MEKIEIMGIRNFAIIGLVCIYLALSFNALFLQNFTIFLIFSSLLFLATFLIIKEEIKEKDMEENFCKFFRDFYDNVSAGMDLATALKKCKYGNYGYLTKYVKEMANAVEWGVPLPKALSNFLKQLRGKFIKKIGNLIIEISYFGGNVIDALRTIDKSLIDLELIKKEKHSRLSLYAWVIIAIYLIFLGIIYVIVSYFPMFFGSVSTYILYFRFMLIFEAFLCGLVMGKVIEESYFRGLKYTSILLFLSSMFIQLWLTI